MSENDTHRNDDDIFIVKVIGTSSKTINIPDEFCKYCDISHGDIVKLKLVGKKSLKEKKGDKK
jgi:hypothetical protein